MIASDRLRQWPMMRLIATSPCLCTHCVLLAPRSRFKYFGMSAQESKTWLGYPEPEDTATIERISAETVAGMIRNLGSSEPKFQLVDVRRSDLTVRTGTCFSLRSRNEMNADIASRILQFS